jgi:hypothetical protein
MPRASYTGVARDGAGNIIGGATISVYLAGTTTAATIYSAYSGGTSTSYVTSGTDGAFTFYADYADYTMLQKFKIVIAKSGFTPKTIDYIDMVHTPKGLKWSDFA